LGRDSPSERNGPTAEMNQPDRVRSSATFHHGFCSPLFIAALVTWMSLFVAPSFAQNASPQGQLRISIAGTVRDSGSKPVAGARVLLKRQGEAKTLESRTNADGAFTFSAPGAGSYTVLVQKTDEYKGVSEVITVSTGKTKRVELVVEDLSAGEKASTGASVNSNAAQGTMEFEDKPDFTVAGVSDWSDLGLHGSDIKVRTSEELAKDTAALKSGGASEGKASAEASPSEGELKVAVARAPENFEANYNLGAFYLRSQKYAQAIPPLEAASRIDPRNPVSAYDLGLAYEGNGDLAKAHDQIVKMLSSVNTADLHRMLGDVDERTGDSLGAVGEYETAVRMDPNEENYFAWGAELLLHRAAGPAAEVFTKGSSTHPDSARMLAGLGAALFATGSYEEAAQKLCAASDLKPADPGPYIFLGEMETATPSPLPCGDARLARFAREQPENALANYYYAMALLKQERRSGSLVSPNQPEELLEKAVSIDPKLGKAFVELGNVYIAREEVGKAIDAYQKAVEASPELSEAHYRLGLAYKRAGKDAEAQEEFQTYEKDEKAETAADEQQRREVRQFLIVLRTPSDTSAPH